MSLCIQVRALRSAQRLLIGPLQIECPRASITTLMGPSGAGKSALLAAICGTLAPGLHFSGEVWLNGQRIDQLPTQARRVGLLFQDDLLFAHMSVLENLLFAIPRTPGLGRRAQAEQAKAQALQALADAELAGFADANPATLSGGQRARVALLRALLAQPQALLLDEPFSRLDQGLRARFSEWVFTQCLARQIPTLLVSHDPQDIADATRVIVLDTPPSNPPAP